jgi:Cd2+/Zn2+-exporting ATPase
MHLRLRVRDLDCRDCARALEQVAGGLDGVDAAAVGFTSSILELDLRDPSMTKPVIRSLRRKGYDVSPLDETPPVRGSIGGAVSRRRLLLTVSCGAMLLVALALHAAGLPSAATRAFLILATAVGLPLALVRAVSAVRSRSIDMNVLMSIAVVAALAIGQWAEAGVVVFLFSTAIILEALAMSRTRTAIQSLMEISPDKAAVKRGGGLVVVDASEAAPGDIMLVKPGERIPLEGAIVTGITSVDESLITGEPMPVSKEPGSQVFAGTMNQEGLVEVRVTKPKQESTLARIIHLVEHVEKSKAPIERVVDRFARIYTPAVVALAVAVGVVPYVLNLQGPWIYRSLVILIIACPCALVIATPVAIVSGLTRAARTGILIKGGAYLEEAARVTAIALDKTGTLTLGRPSVSAIHPSEGISEDGVLEIAASVESASTHPLAGAVLAEARKRKIHFPEPREVSEMPGTGLSAAVRGTRYSVGKPDLFAGRRGFKTRASDAGTGAMAVGVGTDDAFLGTIEFRDDLRPGAADSIAALRRIGLGRLVMLTGDSADGARDIAAAAGVDDYYADLLPHQKVEVIRKMRSGGRVAMVGDGINDAPALAAADVGVAMGAAGSDAAMDAADIALMSDDVRKLVPLFGIARRVRWIVAENIVVALAIKGIFLALAATGTATMWMAVFADMGASLIVIANALRVMSGSGAVAAAYETDSRTAVLS